MPDCGHETLSEVEHHRILRAILRLQLYSQILVQYGASRKLKRRIRLLISSWTTWEFDEVRSVAEWMILEHVNLPGHYASGIQLLFEIVTSHFERSMARYVKSRPPPPRDRHRRSNFAKHSRIWSDTPSTPHEGRADARNKDWKPCDHSYGRSVRYNQKLYRELLPRWRIPILESVHQA